MLPTEEARHLTRVFRLSVGDRVSVFNGRGREWQAMVEEARGQQVRVRLGEAIEPVPESRVAMALIVSALKGDKMDEVVRDAVMLGVTAIRPLITERSDVDPRAVAGGARAARWRRIAIASAKQCGRAVVPDVLAALPLADALALPPRALRVMLVEPSVEGPVRQSIRNVPAAADVELFVGPEGGWADAEVQRAHRAGSMLVTLGAQTLRADAVPLVAITALRVVWGEY